MKNKNKKRFRQILCISTQPYKLTNIVYHKVRLIITGVAGGHQLHEPNPDVSVTEWTV